MFGYKGGDNALFVPRHLLAFSFIIADKGSPCRCSLTLLSGGAQQIWLSAMVEPIGTIVILFVVAIRRCRRI